MNLELTDGQTEALIRELSRPIENDRYPLSPRIVVLREILGKLRPELARALEAAEGVCVRREPVRTATAQGAAVLTR